MSWFRRLDTRFRVWLCKRYGHKFYVGRSGHYVGMPQSRCWRCGAAHWHDTGVKSAEPLGGWFD